MGVKMSCGLPKVTYTDEIVRDLFYEDLNIIIIWVKIGSYYFKPALYAYTFKLTFECIDITSHNFFASHNYTSKRVICLPGNALNSPLKSMLHSLQKLLNASFRVDVFTSVGV